MKLWKALALTALLAAGAGLVWLAGSTVWAAWRETRAVEAWRSIGEPLPALAASFPKTGTNAAAHALETSARALGIRLEPGAGEAAAEESGASKQEGKSEWGVTRAALTKWATAEAERPEEAVQAPPVAVEAWLAGHGSELDAIERALVEGPAPEWAMDTSLLFAAPVPNMAGHLQLHLALVARALARAASGDAAGAERAVLASWKLADPERRRPDVVSRSISWIATHLELGALRKFPADAAAWRGRIAGWDARESVRRSWELEAWTIWQAGRRLSESKPSGGLFADLVARPAERLEAAARLDGWRAMTQAAVRSPISDGDGAFLAEAFRKGMGRWAAVAPPSPALASAWMRADRLALEAELTNKVFDLRAKREPSGAWPPAIPGIETSKGENLKWTYALTADGRASIVTNRLLTWPDRTPSPMGWVSAPPAAKKAPAKRR
jgi:hypothetical protein